MPEWVTLLLIGIAIGTVGLLVVMLGMTAAIPMKREDRPTIVVLFLLGVATIAFGVTIAEQAGEQRIDDMSSRKAATPTSSGQPSNTTAKERP